MTVPLRTFSFLLYFVGGSRWVSGRLYWTKTTEYAPTGSIGGPRNWQCPKHHKKAPSRSHYNYSHHHEQALQHDFLMHQSATYPKELDDEAKFQIQLYCDNATLSDITFRQFCMMFQAG
jgi:hypothetical protein